jgi:hypothetical protein
MIRGGRGRGHAGGADPPRKTRAKAASGGLGKAAVGVRRFAIGGALTLAAATCLALFADLPLRLDSATHGVFLLDWRIRGEETGPCLRTAEEASERVPLHMRDPGRCLGSLPPYRLRLWIDGEPRIDERVEGGGLRGDRPLTVYRELELEPGARALQAEFRREDGEEAVLLALEEEVEVQAGRVLLLVRRQDTGELEIRSPVR